MKKITSIVCLFLFFSSIAQAKTSLTISGELESSILNDLQLSDFNNSTLSWSVQLSTGGDAIAHAYDEGEKYGHILFDCKNKSASFFSQIIRKKISYLNKQKHYYFENSVNNSVPP
jgi:hypothetical protein